MYEDGIYNILSKLYLYTLNTSLPSRAGHSLNEKRDEIPECMSARKKFIKS